MQRGIRKEAVGGGGEKRRDVAKKRNGWAAEAAITTEDTAENAMIETTITGSIPRLTDGTIIDTETGQ